MLSSFLSRKFHLTPIQWISKSLIFLYKQRVRQGGQTELSVKIVVGTRMVSSEHFTACSLLGLPGYENSPQGCFKC